MSNLNTNFVCACGKKRSNLNDTNWKRHIFSCKVQERLKISKTCNTLSTYFLKKRDNSFMVDASDVMPPEKSKFSI